MMRKQETNNGYAILNAQGQLWTAQWFASPSSAQAYIRNASKKHGWDLSKHTIVPARFTVKWRGADNNQ